MLRPSLVAVGSTPSLPHASALQKSGNELTYECAGGQEQRHSASGPGRQLTVDGRRNDRQEHRRCNTTDNTLTYHLRITMHRQIAELRSHLLEVQRIRLAGMPSQRIGEPARLAHSMRRRLTVEYAPPGHPMRPGRPDA